MTLYKCDCGFCSINGATVESITQHLHGRLLLFCKADGRRFRFLRESTRAPGTELALFKKDMNLFLLSSLMPFALLTSLLTQHTSNPSCEEQRKYCSQNRARQNIETGLADKFRERKKRTMSTIVANRVTSSTSSSQIKQEHVKDENDTHNNDYHNENSSNNSSRSDNKYDSFFDEWKVGNWCWERDYNKYPVSPPNCHNDDCMHDKSNSNNEEMRTIHKACDDDGIDDDDDDDDNNNEKKPAAIASSSSSSGSSDKISSNNSNKEIIAAEHKLCGDDGQCGGGGGDDGHDNNGIDDDDDDDEKKPAAIVSSSCSSDCVATTAAMEIAATNDRNVRQEVSKSSSRCPQIKAEKNDNENEDIGNINGRSSNNNNNNNNNNYYYEDDDSFYDDWVEGNWCLLNNFDNSNNISNSNSNINSNNREGEVEDDNSNHEIRHEMTTRSKKKIRDKNKTNDDSTKRKSKRFRFHKDDDHDDEEDSCNKDEEYEENNDDEEEQDSNDVQHHHEDNRPARKRSRPLQIQDDKIWMGMFERLVEYKKQHKNTMVPSRYNHDPKLGIWISTQRTAYRKDELNPNRVDLLQSIGFNWDGAREAIEHTLWMNMFQKLVVYNGMYKNTIIPSRYGEDPKLGLWVSTLRKAYRKDELNPNRVDLLNSINFIWEGKIEHYKQMWLGMSW
jgi:hypothetical protein